MEAINKYIKKNAKRFESEFFEFLRIPSVSTVPAHAKDMQKAAEWLAGLLAKIGFKPELVKTDRHPLIYAETPEVKNAPTVLVYGHFDVQPPDPLDLWISPPFEPTVRKGSVFARGATDDKGQLLTHVYAAEAVLKEMGQLPFQLKFLFEGEEEDGSESIEKYVAENRKKLACDCLVVSDGAMFGPDQPAITCGLRGILAFELTLTGPSRDLHSGVFGGAVFNPAIALAKMMSRMIDDDGRILIPGFYDDVTAITKREKKEFAALPFDEKDFFGKIGLKKGFGEKGFSTLERRWARPTFDINGLTSGYQGEGSKTVLPSKASAKFTCRLVPQQDPKKIVKSIEKYLKNICPSGITMQLDFHHGAKGLLVPLESPFVDAATKAIEKTFGCKPFLMREGGSIPIITMMSEVLHSDVLLLGWGLDDDNLHAPNEKFSLASFHRGIRASAQLLQEIARMG